MSKRKCRKCNKKNDEASNLDLPNIDWGWPEYPDPPDFSERNERVRHAEKLSWNRAFIGPETQDDYEMRLVCELGGFDDGMLPDPLTETDLVGRLTRQDAKMNNADRFATKLLASDDNRVRAAIERILEANGHYKTPLNCSGSLKNNGASHE